jgi:hypothetical protein
MNYLHQTVCDKFENKKWLVVSQYESTQGVILCCVLDAFDFFASDPNPLLPPSECREFQVNDVFLVT